MALAGPYASQIRISDTAVQTGAGATISYILSSAADTVTINIKDSGAATVATFAGTTTQGVNSVVWDGTNDNAGGTALPIAGGYTIEIVVDNVAAAPYQFRDNTSGGGGGGQVFANFSPNNGITFMDQSSDYFGLLVIASSWSGSGFSSGIQFTADGLTQDLADGTTNRGPIHPDESGTIGNGSLWGICQDPADENQIYTAGQGTVQWAQGNVAGGIAGAALTANDDPTTPLGSLFPRDCAIYNGDLYFTRSNSVVGRVGLNGTTLDSTTFVPNIMALAATDAYSKDVQFDSAGNLYWTTKLGATNGPRVYRWNNADVLAAPGVPLTEANASWVIDFPTSTTGAMGVAITEGNVYVATYQSGAGDGAIFEIGPVATASLVGECPTAIGSVVSIGSNNPDVNTTYSNIVADNYGNLYCWDRSTERLQGYSIAGTTSYATVAPNSQTFQIGPTINDPIVYHKEVNASQLGLQALPDNADLINLNVATTISGGFHPANTNPADQEPAFTDGAGLGALTGLLNDFPGEGTPAWSGFWNLGGTFDIGEIRVFSGNTGKDGRIFHNYDAYVTTDPTPSASSAWFPVINTVIPAPFGTINAGTNEACLTVVQSGTAAVIVQGVTALRIDFFAVDNTAGQFRDQWDPANPNDTDGLTFAISSPLIYEVDVYGTKVFAPPLVVPDWTMY